MAIFVRESFNSYHMVNYSKNVDACVIGVNVQGRWLTVIGAYRSPSAEVSNLREFIEIDLDSILSIPKRRTDCIWLADDNIDTLTPKGTTEDFLSRMACHGFQNLIDQPTRCTSNTDKGTAIDHVSIREENIEKITIEIKDSGGLSDHSMILCSVESGTVQVEGPNEIKKRRTDWKKFAEQLKDLNSQKYLREDDPDKLIESLLLEIDDCRQAATREYRVTRRSTPLKPWVNKTIINQMKRRDKLWQQLRTQPGNITLRDKFKKLRNTVKKLLREAESEYLRKQIKISDDPKSTWKTINEQLRGKRCARKLPSILAAEDPDVAELNRANHFLIETGDRISKQV